MDEDENRFNKNASQEKTERRLDTRIIRFLTCRKLMLCVHTHVCMHAWWICVCVLGGSERTSPH